MRLRIERREDRDVIRVRRGLPPLMNRNGYIVSMRPAKLGGGGNVLKGEGPRESRARDDLTVHNRVREVLVVTILVHLDREELRDGERVWLRAARRRS